MSPLAALLILAIVVPISSAAPLPSLLRLATDDGGGGLRSVDDFPDGLYCDSWRLSVETNNAGPWTTIPARCAEFVKDYMTGDRYASDVEVVNFDSVAFARAATIEGDGKDVWVFDIDETLLSNLPYYADNGYGTEAYNETTWDQWVYLAKAPALQASLNLYEELLGLGFQIVLLTGRGEDQRNITTKNLLSSGYHSWKQLILRQTSDIGKPAVVYKSERRAELEAQGFRIHGCSGDQWSDLLGSPMGKRSFKLPNPLYFIA